MVNCCPIGRRTAEETTWELLARSLDETLQTLCLLPFLRSLLSAIATAASLQLQCRGHHQLLRPTSSQTWTLSHPLQTDSIQTPLVSRKEIDTDREKGWLINKKNLHRLRPIVPLCLARGEKQPQASPFFRPFFFHSTPVLERYLQEETQQQRGKKARKMDGERRRDIDITFTECPFTVPLVSIEKVEIRLFFAPFSSHRLDSFAPLYPVALVQEKNTRKLYFSTLPAILPFVVLPALSSLSQCTPPTLHPLFTMTWLCLMTELTPAYRIKLISTKRDRWREFGGVGGRWRRGRGGGGKGRTTTGGQEKSTAGSGHNKEQAAWWLVLGLMFGRMLGVAADERGGLMACFQKRKQG